MGHRKPLGVIDLSIASVAKSTSVDPLCMEIVTVRVCVSVSDWTSSVCVICVVCEREVTLPRTALLPTTNAQHTQHTHTPHNIQHTTQYTAHSTPTIHNTHNAHNKHNAHNSTHTPQHSNTQHAQHAHPRRTHTRTTHTQHARTHFVHTHTSCTHTLSQPNRSYFCIAYTSEDLTFWLRSIKTVCCLSAAACVSVFECGCVC